MVSLSYHVLSLIVLKIMHDLRIRQKHCHCKGCQVFQKTYLDPNKPDELIDPFKPSEADLENPQVSYLEDVSTIFKRLNNVTSGSILVSDTPKSSKVKGDLYL